MIQLLSQIMTEEFFGHVIFIGISVIVIFVAHRWFRLKYKYNIKQLSNPQKVRPQNYIDSSFLLEEYKMLHNELNQRRTIQHQILYLTLFGTGSFISIGIQQASPGFMLLFVLFSQLLAFMYHHHDYRKKMITTYLRERIESITNAKFETCQQAVKVPSFIVIIKRLSCQIFFIVMEVAIISTVYFKFPKLTEKNWIFLYIGVFLVFLHIILAINLFARNIKNGNRNNTIQPSLIPQNKCVQDSFFEIIFNHPNIEVLIETDSNTKLAGKIRSCPGDYGRNEIWLTDANLCENEKEIGIGIKPRRFDTLIKQDSIKRITLAPPLYFDEVAATKSEC